jgi:uncharacterized protein (DUF1330 family)
MKNKYSVSLAIFAGIAIGAAAVHTLHAQVKPPVYVVSEIELTNADAYLKEYAPLARASITKSGGKFIAAGQMTSLEGPPQKSRITIIQYDSLESAQAARNAPDYKEARKIGEKYAKFRAYAVDGVAQ